MFVKPGFAIVTFPVFTAVTLAFRLSIEVLSSDSVDSKAAPVGSGNDDTETCWVAGKFEIATCSPSSVTFRSEALN